MKPVALLAEGVDRNAQDDVNLVGLRRSPSSRRAWIEIGDGRNDRFGGGSPSSRRAWIEIVWSPRCPESRHRRPPRGGRG